MVHLSVPEDSSSSVTQATAARDPSESVIIARVLPHQQLLVAVPNSHGCHTFSTTIFTSTSNWQTGSERLEKDKQGVVCTSCQGARFLRLLSDCTLFHLPQPASMPFSPALDMRHKKWVGSPFTPCFATWYPSWTSLGILDLTTSSMLRPFA